MLNKTNAALEHSTMQENIALEIISALAREALITRADLMGQFEALMHTIEGALTNALEQPMTRSDMAGHIGARLHDEPRRMTVTEMCEFVDQYRAGKAVMEAESLKTGVPVNELMDAGAVVTVFNRLSPASQKHVLANIEPAES